MHVFIVKIPEEITVFRKSRDKIPEGIEVIFKIAVVIKVIRIERVEDDDLRGVVQESTAVFAGLEHEQFAFSDSEILAVELFQFRPDDNRWIELIFDEYLRDERRDG